MTIVKTLAVAALAGVAFTSAASAADLYTAPATTTETMPVYDNASFNWNRFYVGVFGGAQNQASSWSPAIGANAGINTQFDFVLLGAEVALLGVFDNNNVTGTYGQITAKAGAVLTDDFVAYAAAGYGGDLGSSTTISDSNWLVGGGLEYAVTDNVSVKGQYLHGFDTGNAGSAPIDQVSIGANFHF